MSNYAPETPAPRRSRLSPYIAMWGVLALVAVAYIGWIATHPELIARNDPAPVEPSGETNEGQRAMSDALAELKTLKDTVGEVQKDVTQLKTDVSSTLERSERLTSRIAALEPKTGKPVASVSASPSPVASAATAPSTTAPEANLKQAPASPPATAKVINAKPSDAKLETGSVAAPAIAASSEPVVFGPAVVKPTPKPVGIQIATGPSLDAVRLSWSLLSDRHGDMLRKLEPRAVATTGPDGESYDLVAGPIKSATEAKKVCAALEAKSVPCNIVGDFKGEAL